MANFARASITNTFTKEKLEFQFNPVSWVEQLEAVYSSSPILFGSHDIVHWTNTRSMQIPLELIYTLMGSNTLRPVPPGNIEQSGNYQRTDLGLNDAINFLKALMYPDPNSLQKAPPRVIFNWPTVTTIFAYVVDLETSYEDFDIETLAPYTLRARLTLTEVSTGPINNTDVRLWGSRRADERQISASRDPAEELPSPTRRFMRETISLDGNPGGWSGS